METKEQKQFYVNVNGQKVEVSEEVYRAYVRPIRAQQRAEKRNKRCKVKGERFGLVRCKGNCSECEYAKSGKAFGSVEQSLDALTESGFELPSESDIEVDLLAEEERNEQMEKLRSAIASLSERQRFILQEVYFHNQTQEEVAMQLQISQQAVSMTLKKAITNLKKYFGIF